MDDDLYALLGVDSDVPSGDLKRAFRKMAKIHHPDLNPNDEQAAARFVLLTQAFEILSDPLLRALYDEFGRDGLRPGFDPVEARRRTRTSWTDDSSFESVFDDIHKDDPFRANAFDAHAPGSDLRRDMTIDASIAAEGGVEAFEHQGDVVAIRIPPHTQDGDIVCVPREGAESLHPEGRPGDLLVTIRIASETHEGVEDLDVSRTILISIPEAILGTKLPVDTPQGRVTMTIPEGVHSSAVLRLKGLGLDGPNGTRGDVLIHLDVRAPDRLTARTRDAARALKEAYITPLREEVS